MTKDSIRLRPGQPIHRNAVYHGTVFHRIHSFLAILERFGAKEVQKYPIGGIFDGPLNKLGPQGWKRADPKTDRSIVLQTGGPIPRFPFLIFHFPFPASHFPFALKCPAPFLILIIFPKNTGVYPMR